MSARDQLSPADEEVQRILALARGQVGHVTMPYSIGWMAGFYCGQLNGCYRLGSSPELVEAAKAEIEAMFPRAA